MGLCNPEGDRPSMLLKKLAARAALLASLALFASQAALAQGFVSIRGDVVNVRERPTTRSTVLWELTDGYPLRVTRKTRNWIKVRDFEGDLGWVSRKLVDRDPHHIVKARIANLRSKPAADGGIAWFGLYLFNNAIADTNPPYWLKFGLDLPVLLFVVAVALFSLFLLGIVGLVQIGFIAMFWSFWRRAREQRRFRESLRLIDGGPHP